MTPKEQLKLRFGDEVGQRWSSILHRAVHILTNTVLLCHQQTEYTGLGARECQHSLLSVTLSSVGLELLDHKENRIPPGDTERVTVNKKF